VLAPTQIVVGDLHGLNTLEHQPAKIAAIEALWKTQKGAPLVLFGIPDELTRENRYSIEVPRGASLILRHDPNAEVRGLDAFRPDTPPVTPVFFAFRVMVGTAFLMLTVAWVGSWATRRGKLPSRRLLWVVAAMSFSGWMGTISGWLVTEIGRQPWLVTGVLRTADAIGDVPAHFLGASFTGYLLVYAIMLVAYLVVLTHLAGQGAGSIPAESPRAVT
jgi:cytochrome d ubiquinol oxidase subunit I